MQASFIGAQLLVTLAYSRLLCFTNLTRRRRLSRSRRRRVLLSSFRAFLRFFLWTINQKSISRHEAETGATQPPCRRLQMRARTHAMASHYHAIVWIDHREAKVFNFNATEVDRMILHPHNPTRHIHHKANAIGGGGAPGPGVLRAGHGGNRRCKGDPDHGSVQRQIGNGRACGAPSSRHRPSRCRGRDDRSSERRGVDRRRPTLL